MSSLSQGPHSTSHNASWGPFRAGGWRWAANMLENQRASPHRTAQSTVGLWNQLHFLLWALILCWRQDFLAGVMWMLLSCVCVHLLTGGYKLLSCCIIVEIHAWGSPPTSSRVTCWLLMKNGRTRWRNDSSFLLKFLEAIQEVMEEWEFLFLVIHFLSSFFFLARLHIWRKRFSWKKNHLISHIKKKKKNSHGNIFFHLAPHMKKITVSWKGNSKKKRLFHVWKWFIFCY